MQDNIEKQICERIVDKALAAGYTISVYDGEAWPLQRTSNRPDILAAMYSTDSDVLRFQWPESGELIGSVLLIYGNGDDVVSDYTDNEAMAALVKEDA
jgi:hypothetical protein